MSIILDTQPYMLYETVGMLVKYVNGISMLEVRDTMLRLYRKGLVYIPADGLNDLLQTF